MHYLQNKIISDMFKLMCQTMNNYVYRHFYLHRYLLFYNVAVTVCVPGMGGIVNLRFTPVASHLYKQPAVRSHLSSQRKNVVGLISVFYTPD